jgi:3-methyladenine DNA glycosylase/8-oxoguanine DNA glycosylase
MLPDASQSWTLPEPYDLIETTRWLRLGGRDPTVHRAPDGLWRTARTTEGPVTVRLTAGTMLRADAWGPGAQAVLQDIPQWTGLSEPAWTLPPHPVVDRLLRATPGVRLTDTRDVFEALVNTVLQQLVTWEHAAMTWRRLCHTVGEVAPGPVDMRLSPTARAIRAAGTMRLQAAGIGPKQARTLMTVAGVAHALRRASDLPTPEAAALLQKVPGIGPWTAAMVLGLRLGRPEPVPVGDVHLPSTIAYALAGEPRASDARMLELLEPFGDQAFRVVRLVWAAGIMAPRRGPRFPWRSAV